MSLQDALLLEPVQQSFWIALRGGREKGSGSEVDPWNGGRADHPVLIVSAVTIALAGGTGPNFTVSVKTTTPHGFAPPAVGEPILVLMSGFAGRNGELLNGCFVITPHPDLPDEFTYTVIYDKVGQLPGLPLGALGSVAGVTCQLDPFLFDAVMRSLPTSSPVTVHLGPGVFETKGYQYSCRDTVSWRPFAGLKLRGSGMSVTTLRLVEASYRNVHYHVIGMPPLYKDCDVADGFEVSDITLDCNNNGQRSTQLTCGAVSIRGSHTRVSRVRAIRFGRQGPIDRTELSGTPPSWTMSRITPELFLFSVGGSSWKNNAGKYQSRDCVIEQCVIEEPALNSAREGTMLAVSMSDSDSGNQVAIPSLDTVFRNNSIDCEYRDNPVVILAITPGARSDEDLPVTVTTQKPHGFSVGSWCRVWGVHATTAPPPDPAHPPPPAVLLDGYNNALNGSFPVSWVSADGLQFMFVATLVPYLPTVTLPLAGAWVGRWPSDLIKIRSVSTPSLVSGTTFYEMVVETQSPHFLIPSGSNVPLSPMPSGCIASLNGIAQTPASGYPVEDLNLPWVVTAWTSATKFTCRRDYEGKTPPTPVKVDQAYLGANRWGFSGATLAEGNSIRSVTRGGPYTDTFGVPNMVVRYNLFSRVHQGMFQTLQQIFGFNNYPGTLRPKLKFLSLRPAAPVPGDRVFALFEMDNGLPHFLIVGQGILIAGARNSGGVLIDEFNRSFKIFAIPAPNMVEVELDGVPPSLPGPSNRPTFDWMMVCGVCSYQGNIVEMLPAIPLATNLEEGIRSSAVTLEGVVSVQDWLDPNWIDTPEKLSRRQFYRYQTLDLRNNFVRYATLPSGGPMTGYPFLERAMVVQSVGGGSMAENAFDTGWPPSYLVDTPTLQKTWMSGVPKAWVYLNPSLDYFGNTSPSVPWVPGSDENRPGRYHGIQGVVNQALTFSML